MDYFYVTLLMENVGKYFLAVAVKTTPPKMPHASFLEAFSEESVLTYEV